MKSLKKALAVLLSVLMVAFSFPLTSFALPNPNNTDGRYSYDDDVIVHTYVVDYDGTDSWGYNSNNYFDNHDGAGEVPTYDLKHLKSQTLLPQTAHLHLLLQLKMLTLQTAFQ